MTKLRVLFIDDDELSVRSAIKWLNETAYSCKCTSFPNFIADVEEFQPHIAVVDRLEGIPPSCEEKGSRIFDLIWDSRFCPIIIYSAFPDDEEDTRKRHPLVLSIKKGQDLGEFKKAIVALAPHAQALEKAEQHIRQQFAFALRDVAPYAVSVFSDPTERENAIARHGRRRLAALMDEMTMGKLASWEQYIVPPVAKSLMLGDIIRLRDGSADDARAFRVNLTPSCDLASFDGRKPKVKHILAAACCHPKQGIQKTSLGQLMKSEETRSTLNEPMKYEETRNTLNATLLSQGYHQRIVPFPALKGVLPAMMADMKRLELIAVEEIVITMDMNGRYIRVASLDSPFREMISWAYMQTACRPGLPDRDLDSWNKEIMDICGV